MARLSAYLERAAARPFEWGTDDCALFIANWVAEALGVDPAADLRGRYRTRLGAARALRRAGGMIETFGPRLEAVGLARLPDEANAPGSGPGQARRGDVGVVRAITPAGEELIGAVCVGERWAALMAKGLLVARFAPVAVWRMEWPKP